MTSPELLFYWSKLMHNKYWSCPSHSFYELEVKEDRCTLLLFRASKKDRIILSFSLRSWVKMSHFLPNSSDLVLWSLNLRMFLDGRLFSPFNLPTFLSQYSLFIVILYFVSKAINLDTKVSESSWHNNFKIWP